MQRAAAGKERYLPTYLLLTAAILTEVAGTISLRHSHGFSNAAAVALVVSCYGISFFLLSLILARGVPVAVVYAVWSAAGIVLVTAVGVLFLKEPFTPWLALGIGMIVAGVVVLEITTASN